MSVAPEIKLGDLVACRLPGPKGIYIGRVKRILREHVHIELRSYDGSVIPRRMAVVSRGAIKRVIQ